MVAVNPGTEARGADQLAGSRGPLEDRRAPLLVVSLVLLVCMVIAVLVRAFVDQPDPASLRELGLLLLPDAVEVKPFSLTDQRGVAFGPERLEGNWTLLFFGFASCPDVCPTTLAKLKKAVDGLDDAPRVALVTVDPARDTEALLGGYVEAFDPAFLGLRGSAVELQAFAEQFHVNFTMVPGADGKYLMEHTAHIVVLDPQGRHAGFFMTPHEPERMREALQAVR